MVRVRSILNRLLDFLRGGTRPSPQRQAPPPPRARAGVSPPVQRPLTDSRGQVHTYLRKVRAKLDKLAEDFNAGVINRAQFQNLYAHYQREIRSIEEIVEYAPASESWKGMVTEGQSVLIRRRHLARAQGYAIYENDSGMPLSTLGEFQVDPALLVPMLSSYRAAAQEIFGSGVRSTAIEGGRWLCFVPGNYTTLLAVFSTEPAGKQLDVLDELHRLFERANRSQLTSRTPDPSALLFPHEYFLGQWRR
jgi:hypothetical protein